VNFNTPGRRPALQSCIVRNLQRIQHGLDARDFVGAEQIGLAQCGQHGKERFGAAHLVAEKFKGMRQRVANRETKRSQPERVRKMFI